LRRCGGTSKQDQFPVKTPLLAHYTSLDALEKILENNEVWFSNPLFMNDFEEVNFGVTYGVSAIRESRAIQDALGTSSRFSAFISSLEDHVNYFAQNELFDTYVFCLSEHDRSDRDGRLSMWRGYGGNGGGAAIIFDTAQFSSINASPLIVAKVEYASTAVRRQYFSELATATARIIAQHTIPDTLLTVGASAVFERIKMAALFSKHDGFKEEQEWRIVYLRGRDNEGHLTSMQNYFNGTRGVEPKLKLKIEPIEAVTAPDFSLGKIVHSILLGPTTSSPLAIRSVTRMLEVVGKPELIERLVASTIPYRPVLVG